VIAIDWSGSADDGGARHTWLARAASGQLVELVGGRTRAAVLAELAAAIGRATGPLVVGLDFAFSLPAWWVEAHGLPSAGDLWDLVERDGEAWLACCDPPFWGRAGRRRPAGIEQFRRTEREVGEGRAIRPKSVFQIGGAGAVGTGSVRGMPYLARLREAGYSIWPFDPPSSHRVVEIYPRLLTGPVVKSSRGARRDHLQASARELPEALAEVAESNEDAFDAALSALAMSDHLSELCTLPAAVDPTTLLEGAIWLPPGSTS